jgi:hypothetical protein
MSIYPFPGSFRDPPPPRPEIADFVRVANAERSQALKNILLALFGRRPPDVEPVPAAKPVRRVHPSSQA